MSESDGYVTAHFTANDREGNAQAEKGICKRGAKTGLLDYK
jgi:hypothetical protein